MKTTTTVRSRPLHPSTRAALERLTGIDALVGLALQGEGGRHWYRAAERAIRSESERVGVTPERFANILAITSPRVKVRRNWTLTVQYLMSGSLEGIMKSSRAALAHYEATGEIRGPKTGPFARAVLGDRLAVVLDTWMARAFNVEHRRFASAAIREECSRRIQAAAGILGWSPAEVQAAVWTAVVVRAGKTPGTF